MVQTREGAKNSEWLQYMRECAVAYRQRKEVPPTTPSKKVTPPVTAPRRRKRATEGKLVEEPPGS